VIQKSKALFVNGFAFDELAPSVVLDAMMCAQEAGCAVAFDPGPRAHTLFRSTVHNRNILEQLLCLCDILLLTADEVCDSLAERLLYSLMTFYYVFALLPHLCTLHSLNLNLKVILCH
jgi:sugar/nucleoside kinase (ribokinase family)